MLELNRCSRDSLKASALSSAVYAIPNNPEGRTVGLEYLSKVFFRLLEEVLLSRAKLFKTDLAFAAALL